MQIDEFISTINDMRGISSRREEAEKNYLEFIGNQPQIAFSYFQQLLTNINYKKIAITLLLSVICHKNKAFLEENINLIIQSLIEIAQILLSEDFETESTIEICSRLYAYFLIDFWPDSLNLLLQNETKTSVYVYSYLVKIGKVKINNEFLRNLIPKYLEMEQFIDFHESILCLLTVCADLPEREHFKHYYAETKKYIESIDKKYLKTYLKFLKSMIKRELIEVDENILISIPIFLLNEDLGSSIWYYTSKLLPEISTDSPLRSQLENMRDNLLEYLIQGFTPEIPNDYDTSQEYYIIDTLDSIYFSVGVSIEDYDYVIEESESESPPDEYISIVLARLFMEYTMFQRIETAFINKIGYFLVSETPKIRFGISILLKSKNTKLYNHSKILIEQIIGNIENETEQIIITNLLESLVDLISNSKEDLSDLHEHIISVINGLTNNESYIADSLTLISAFINHVKGGFTNYLEIFSNYFEAIMEDRTFLLDLSEVFVTMAKNNLVFNDLFLNFYITTFENLDFDTFPFSTVVKIYKNCLEFMKTIPLESSVFAGFTHYLVEYCKKIPDIINEVPGDENDVISVELGDSLEKNVVYYDKYEVSDYILSIDCIIKTIKRFPEFVDSDLFEISKNCCFSFEPDICLHSLKLFKNVIENIVAENTEQVFLTLNELTDSLAFVYYQEKFIKILCMIYKKVPTNDTFSLIFTFIQKLIELNSLSDDKEHDVADPDYEYNAKSINLSNAFTKFDNDFFTMISPDQFKQIMSVFTYKPEYFSLFTYFYAKYSPEDLENLINLLGDLSDSYDQLRQAVAINSMYNALLVCKELNENLLNKIANNVSILSNKFLKDSKKEMVLKMILLINEKNHEIAMTKGLDIVAFTLYDEAFLDDEKKNELFNFIFATPNEEIFENVDFEFMLLQFTSIFENHPDKYELLANYLKGLPFDEDELAQVREKFPFCYSNITDVLNS